MKKIIKIATLTAIIALSVAMVAACNKVESINIKSANLPNQLIYVVGSDLNLAGGSLSVVGKKETTLIELESPGVTVSGYDKNKIGQQEVTVSYEGKTTTFSVTVVPRMVAENIELDYFVGDEFNDKGRLRITRDDGTAFTVPVNDEAITVTGFDSSVAKAPLAVTATYNESGVTYTGTFNVNIYDVSETDFKAPTKKDYLSHEAGIDLSGSYFTIKGGVGGALTRYIEVTDDMIEGFDLSAADISNKETPLDQKVTVKYSGEEYYFNVNITYTNVSYIKDNLETFADLDWSDKLPDVSTRVGEVAISLWNAYTTLEDSEKALLTEEEKLAFVRPAVVYSYNLWVAEITAYPNSFNALTTGPQLVCTTYNDAVKGYEVLTDPENILAVAGAIIKGIDAEFSQSVLCGTNLISTLSSIVYTKETMDKFAGYIEYMIALYDALKDVPAEWTSQSLADYASDIQAATEIILNSEYKTSEYSAFYDRVSSWRENNDYIDILYAYFYYVEKNEDVLYSLQKVRLPGVLEELYTVITSAMNQISSMTAGKQHDTTFFMLYYDMALNCIDVINKDENPMYKDLYENMKFDGLLTIGGEAAAVPFSTLMLYLKTTTGGYLYHANALLDDEEFNTMWNTYFDVLYRIINDEEYSESEQYKKDIEAAFKYFVEMSPSWQYGYLISLHTYYRSGQPALALDVAKTGMFSMFVNYTASYYYNALPEGGAREVFTELLLALEYYARRNVSSTGLSDFLVKMYSVTTKYKLLSDTDREAFRSLLGFFYDKYNDIYARYEDVSNPTVTDLGEWKDEFDALKEAVQRVSVAYTSISNAKLPIYSALISAGEEVFRLSDYIKKNAPENILNAYCHEDIVELADGRKVSLDFGLFYTKSVFNNFLQSNSIYDVYTSNSAVRAFMLEAYEFIWTTLYYDDEATEPNYKDAAAVYAMMQSFRNLGEKNQIVFLVIDSSARIYQTGLAMFFKENLTEKAAAVATLLVDFERCYVQYKNNPDGEETNAEGATVSYLTRVRDAMNALKTAYGELEGEDLVSFQNALGSVYETYLALYKELNIPTLPVA